MTLSNKWLVAAVLLLFLLPAAYSAWSSRDMAYLGAWHDDAIYWVSAKSLAEGHGYRIASLPDGPWQTKYPPLFALYLSIVWRIAPEFPGNLPLATLFCWLLLPVWLALAWRMLLDLGLSRAHALALCGVLALNQHAVMFGMVMMSEVMASIFILASVLLATRAVASPRLAALAGLFGGLAYLTKSASLPLILAAPLYLAFRKQRRGAVAYVLLMLPAVAAWNLWMRAHLSPATDSVSLYYTNYMGYQAYNIGLADLPQAIVRNIERLFWAIGSLVFGMGESAVEDVPMQAALFIARVVAGLTLVGMIRHLRRTGITPYHLFAAGYVLMMLVWHYPPNERFLFPILPLLLAGFSVQLAGFADLFRPSGKPARIAGLAFAGAMACLWCALIAERFVVALPRGVDVYRRLRASNTAAYQWIAANTPADARFLAYEDPILYLYAGRTGCRRNVPTRYFYHSDVAGVRDIIDSLPAFAREHRLQYVLTTPGDFHGELLPKAIADDFRREMNEIPNATPVFRSELTAVYRLDTDRHAAAKTKVE